MHVFKLPDGRWRVQIRRKGFPTYNRIFHTREDAEQDVERHLGQQRSITNSSDITLQVAWDRYRESLEFGEKSPQTQRTEANRIKPVLHVLGAYSLANLESASHLIYDYIDNRSKVVSSKTKKRISPSSVRLEIAALSAVIAWALERRILRSNFVSGIKRPGRAKRKRRVPPVEQGKLEMAVLHRGDPKLSEAARFALLLRHLGCRPGELACLRREDIRLRRSEMTFRDTKFQGEDRTVHATPEAVQLLNAQFQYALEYAPKSVYLFSTQGKQRDAQGRIVWKPFGFSCAVKRLRKAGVVKDDFHAHAMRREFISRAIEAGMEYSTIGKQTGHHSTQAIEIYDEGLSTAPEIREALDKHSKQVELEKILGMLEAHGLSQDAIEDVKAQLTGKQRPFFRRVYSDER